MEPRDQDPGTQRRLDGPSDLSAAEPTPVTDRREDLSWFTTSELIDELLARPNTSVVLGAFTLLNDRLEDARIEHSPTMTTEQALILNEWVAEFLAQQTEHEPIRDD